MRFYDIQFTDPDGQLLGNFGFARNGFNTTYSSYLGGQNISGALNVEFNIPQAPFATPQQGSWLRIWGVPLDELARSNNLGPTPGSGSTPIKLNGISIRAGMQKGLPLAKPQQIGTIVKGSIFKPFGNWQETDMTLEMVILPAVGNTNSQNINIPFNYPKNKPLSDAIKQSLTTGLTNYDNTVQVSPALVLPYDAAGSYTTLTSFAAMILKLSLQQQFQGIKTLGGGTYGGVQTRVVGNTVTVYDGTTNYSSNSFSSPKAIAFEDLIGQPTWIGPNSINFKCVMRGDINVGDYISLPTSLAIPYVLSTPGASLPGTASRNNLTFQGSFIIINVRHYGNFRSPNANAWVTVYNATYVGNPGSLIAAPTS